MHATHLIWRGAGSPAPVEGDGTPVRQYAVTAPCAHCGEIDARYRLKDAISDDFTTVKNNGRAWPFGGDRLCAPCVFAAKSLALKCALWFARESGVWLVGTRPIPGFPQTRPDALAALLNPPEPPFVAGFGAYGVDHGGEANADRCWWPDGYDRASKSLSVVDEDGKVKVKPYLLQRLQSKHVAIYARLATSRTRYPLQVDDQDVVVDVPLWTRLRAVCDALLVELRAAGVGATDARDALRTGRPPPRCPLPLLARWRERTEPLAAHRAAGWFAIFVELLLMPEFTEQPKKATKTNVKRNDAQDKSSRRRPDSDARQRSVDATSARVPDARDHDARDEGVAWRAPVQQSLF